MQAQQASATPQQKAVVTFLRNKAGLKIRKGVLNGTRVEYFKGSSAIKAIRSDAYRKLADGGKVPKVPADDEKAPIELLHSLLPTAHYLMVDRGGAIGPASTGGAAPPPTSGPTKPSDQIRTVTIAPQQSFQPDGYYVWLWIGPQWTVYLGGIGMVGAVLAAVMFPLWPPIMRLGVWYLSMGVLVLIGLFFLLAIVRLIVYVVTIFVAKPGLWIFPNLFADVGFVRRSTLLILRTQVDSFIPTYEWVQPPAKKGKKSKAEGGKSKKLKAPSAEASGSSRVSTPVPPAAE